MDMKKYASEFARIGGKTITEKKSMAARKNGKLGGRPKHIRYYLHGDKHESENIYFCIFCDAFEPLNEFHINSDNCLDSGLERYKWSRKRFYANPGKFFRPKSADNTNLVA